MLSHDSRVNFLLTPFENPIPSANPETRRGRTFVTLPFFPLHSRNILDNESSPSSLHFPPFCRTRRISINNLAWNLQICESITFSLPSTSSVLSSDFENSMLKIEQQRRDEIFNKKKWLNRNPCWNNNFRQFERYRVFVLFSLFRHFVFRIFLFSFIPGTFVPPSIFLKDLSRQSTRRDRKKKRKKGKTDFISLLRNKNSYEWIRSGNCLHPSMCIFNHWF